MVAKELTFIYPPNTLVGLCRGKQRADALGAQHGTYDENTKAVVLVRSCFDIETKVVCGKFSAFLDPGDCFQIACMMAHSFDNCPFIGATRTSTRFLQKSFGRPVLRIPDHHCNYERVTRPKDRPVRTVGYVGSVIGIDFNLDLLRSALNNAGFEFKALFVDSPEDVTREKLCEFIQSLDIMVSFRKISWGMFRLPEMMPCLKIINSLAFKVPIVCEFRPSYEEEGFGQSCMWVEDFDGIIRACKSLKESRFAYEEYAEKGFEKVIDLYHVENVSKQYLEMLL